MGDNRARDEGSNGLRLVTSGRPDRELLGWVEKRSVYPHSLIFAAAS